MPTSSWWPTSRKSSIVEQYAKLVADKTGFAPEYVIIGTTALSSAVGLWTYRRYFKRIQNAEWVTPAMSGRWIKGYVTHVRDGDDFHLYHMPGFGWGGLLGFRRIPASEEKLRGQTIHIRVAGIDAPETSHFGRPAQKFSDESLAWLRGEILGQVVYCQLLKRDQYNRVVALVHHRPRFLLPGCLFTGRSVGEAMLREGWATVYQQFGAAYREGPGGKQEYLDLQKEAQDKKLGIWEHGTDIETPAEYKKRYAQAGGSLQELDSEASETLQDASPRPSSPKRKTSRP